MQTDEEQENTDLSTLLLFECSIQTYLQFKGRFNETNAILSKIELFLNEFLLKALFIQTNGYELNNIKSYLSQKGFNSLLEKYAELNNLTKYHKQFVKMINCDEEFYELKIKNLLSLIHRSFDATSSVNDELVQSLLGLCRQDDAKKCQKMCELILTDSIIKCNAFKFDCLNEFLIKLVETNETFLSSTSLFDEYLNKFLFEIQTIKDLSLGLKFISKLQNLNQSFLINLSSHKNINSSEYYVMILLKNREIIICNENLRLFELCFKNLLKFLTKFWEENNELSLNMVSINDIEMFLCNFYKFKPNLCQYLLRCVVKKTKKLESFMQYLNKYAQKFVLLARTINEVEEKMEVDIEQREDTTELNFSKEYSYTLSKKDQNLLQTKYKSEKNFYENMFTSTKRQIFFIKTFFKKT